MTRRASQLTYCLVLIVLFMPFVTVSCGTVEITLTGTQLAMGVSGPNPVPAQPLMAVALVCAILGIALGFADGKLRVIGSALVGAVGCVSVLLFRSQMDAELVRAAASGGFFHAEYQPGYWLAVALCLVGFALNAALCGVVEALAPPSGGQAHAAREI